VPNGEPEVLLWAKTRRSFVDGQLRQRLCRIISPRKLKFPAQRSVSEARPHKSRRESRVTPSAKPRPRRIRRPRILSGRNERLAGGYRVVLKPRMGRSSIASGREPLANQQIERCRNDGAISHDAQRCASGRLRHGIAVARTSGRRTASRSRRLPDRWLTTAR
jgi:hypothetical protein